MAIGLPIGRMGRDRSEQSEAGAATIGAGNNPIGTIPFGTGDALSDP